MPVKKRLNPKRLGERNRFLENRSPFSKDKDRFTLKKKKLKTDQRPALVKKRVKGKSAEELYDSKRKSFRGSKIENFKLGGVAKTLINKYKAKLKNEKEDYGLYSKQDYSDVIKKAEKTKKRIQRNRKVAGAVGGTTAATVVASNVKDKK